MRAKAIKTQVIVRHVPKFGVIALPFDLGFTVGDGLLRDVEIHPWSRAAGSHRTALRAVNRAKAAIDAIVARYILQLLASMLVAIIIFATSTSEPSHLNSMNLGVVVAAFVVTTVFGLGVGLVNIPMFNNYPLYEQIFNLINRPMFMISGVFFLPDSNASPGSASAHVEPARSRHHVVQDRHLPGIPR